MNLEPHQQKRILQLKNAIVERFDRGKWQELGLLTGFLNEVRSHPRLIRSWDFGDDDYPGHVLDILVTMATRDAKNIQIIEDYVLNDDSGLPITIEGERKRSAISPIVFDLPDTPIDPRLVAVMMPFETSFNAAYDAIKSACANASLACQRADDIWQHSTVIQDVFGLIWRSSIVVCDFSGRNPNVFYEAGIAHTLGRHVVPIARHKSDIPFDLQHHRFLEYYPNSEGLSKLSDELRKRLVTLSTQE